MRDRLEEIERLRDLAVGRDELDALLDRAPRLLQPVEDAESLEAEPGVGHQRLADVIARKRFTLQQYYPSSVLRQHRRGRCAGRSTPDHDGVV